MPVLSAIKNYCLPRNFETALFRGYMFVYVYAWIMNSLFFALYHKNTKLAVVSAIGVPLAIFATWLHEKGSRNAATALRTFSAMALISYIAYKTGGVRSPVLVWNFVVVLGGLLVFGEKRGFVLLVVSMIQVIGLYYASRTAKYNALAAFSFLNTIPFIYIVGVIFLRQKQLSFSRLQSEKSKVEIANQNIESILASSPSLIAIFDANHIIVASAAFHRMFPHAKSFVPAITDMFPQTSQAAMLEALSISLDADEISFEANYACLPSRLEIQGAEYSLKWTPISGKDGVVRRIQFEANNVSELFAQQEKAVRNELIAAVYNAGVAKVRKFLPRATEYFLYVRERSLESLEAYSRESYIRLHTTKGEARSLGFVALAEAIHQAEDGLNSLDLDKLLTHLRRADSHLQSIRDVALKFDLEPESFSLPKVVEVLRRRREREFLMEQLPTVTSLVKARESSLVEIAKDLGKPTPRLLVSGSEARLSLEAVEALDQLLVHALRNALSHGIESVAERQGLQKTDAGTITVSCAKQIDGLILSVSDDGRGLALAQIHAKAVKLGLIRSQSMSPSDIAELIFQPGFSTAAEVSQISGRGVGMDAIRSALEKIGGSVHAEVLREAPMAPWRLLVQVPKVHVLNWEG